MSEIQNKLKEKIQEAETIRKIQSYTVQLQSRLTEEENALAVMEQTLAKEQRDVELLEKEGLTTMFHKFLGDREDRLQIERQEYLTAALKYNEIYKSVDLIRYELNLLSKKEQNLGNVEKEITGLIKQREAEIMQLEPTIAAQLQGLHEQVDKLHKFETEVNQALSTGNDAFDKVRKTEYYLNEAQFPDKHMWGSGYQSKIVNHQAVDYARDMAYQSRQSLIRFGNEYRDVYPERPFQINMELEDFGRFAEVFFNNLISDWILRQKVSKSLITVRGTVQQVGRFVEQLNQEKLTIVRKLQELEMERKRTIVSSE
ncbi:MAG: hypothetical protein IPP15_09225 [Saprospiraceae bacterium]|uniref:Uncharacterized protein n=1 Tax=Candidatus Opimibacter skivensis TaxID=2982028 RepID=A0A9D7SSZ5_9BACT|nr:hypothetical protein [Candidatus Opimibacter skivensis]